MQRSRSKIQAAVIGVTMLVSVPVSADKFYCDNRTIVAASQETSLLGEVVTSKNNIELQVLMTDAHTPTDTRRLLSPNTVVLEVGQMTTPGFSKSFKSLSGMIPMNLKFSIDQGVDGAARASYVDRPGKPSPFKTMPDEKIQEEIGRIIADKKSADKLADLLKSQGGQCTTKITSKYRLAYNAISGPDMFRFAKQLLDDEQSFKKNHPGISVDKYKAFIQSAGSLLDSCYLPAEGAQFSNDHKLFDLIGSIYTDQLPICSGLIFNKGNHVLTARHCFEFVSHVELQRNSRDRLWFKKAGGEDEYQICAILEKDALDRTKFEKASDDQVMVRIAAPITNAPNIAVISSDAIKVPSGDEGGPDTPTQLIQISLFPLASLIRPTTFKTGFVQGSNPSCVALSKEQGCFGHSCSAIPGGSGASIFLAKATTLSLVGTHIGDSQSKSDCKIPGQRQVNVAAYINRAVSQ